MIINDYSTNEDYEISIPRLQHQISELRFLIDTIPLLDRKPGRSETRRALLDILSMLVTFEHAYHENSDKDNPDPYIHVSLVGHSDPT